jgi:hypothetical protein
VDDQRVTRTVRENGLGSLDAGRYQGVTRALTGLELIKTTTPMSWDGPALPKRLGSQDARAAAAGSALEARTREQLPQDWAETQNNLGGALKEQGIRTAGAKGTELLIQAVAAYRSCLEIYTAEAFPFFHERMQEQLKECERLLTEAQAQ